ncbi:hypothetical protein K9N68_12455 [Kovacikia minuta CCNUW1]|uniref:hypothetical protein n=1 Tax=Kovacikia minuta TaxID=2931930 RepID=UPI001CC93FC4|nr:hypothetical protein [Kovacikia minuta]UBF28612.1 hypothetical protein K9N68_12455 [Kovacikia minuta CCNUW1]
MTSQSLMTNSSARVSSNSATLSSVEAVTDFPVDARQSRLLQAMRSQYRLDQQMKYLHLQAETESLLQQLRAIKQQRQASREDMLTCYSED